MSLDIYEGLRHIGVARGQYQAISALKDHDPGSISMAASRHEWSFFRAGNVAQVDLKSTADLENLAELDLKLWMALSMPTKGLSGEAQSLELIDSDLDGHIRPPEILATVAWLRMQLSDLQAVLEGRHHLELAHLREEKLVRAAKNALRRSGRADALEISLVDIEKASEQLAAERFNGDGVVIPDCSDDSDLKALLENLILNYQFVPDRSGGPGLNKDILHSFLSELNSNLLWRKEADDHKGICPLGWEGTQKAFNALQPVASKINDYFARSQWVVYDPRAHAEANRLETEPSALPPGSLSLDAELLKSLPLAPITGNAALPLSAGINPAWQDLIDLFIKDVLLPFFPDHNQNSLEMSEWKSVQSQMQAFSAWIKRQPANKISAWDPIEMKRIQALDAGPALEALIARDEEVNSEYNDLRDLHKLLLLTRDFIQILRNYVNFADFYRGKGALFQLGELFIDGRATRLCVDVSNPAKHVTMAGLSGAYLVYCDCSRSGQATKSIVAALTAGDSDNLMVGRNGVFYDRSGRDWDATVTRIVANPISLKEAFWLPYKKLARFIEEQVAKRAASADAAATGDLAATAQTVANVDRVDKTKTLPIVGRKVDVGTVAAMGVALGSIGTFFGLLFGKFIDLGLWMPIGIVALVFLISGPSMLLALLKLRNRNLGPLLDANGWAINAMARINVPFAASLTQMRHLPLRVGTTLPDPYAEAQPPWRSYALLIAIVLMVVLWSSGKCDRILPRSIKSERVFSQFDKEPLPAVAPAPALLP